MTVSVKAFNVVLPWDAVRQNMEFPVVVLTVHSDGRILDVRVVSHDFLTAVLTHREHREGGVAWDVSGEFQSPWGS